MIQDHCVLFASHLMRLSLTSYQEEFPSSIGEYLLVQEIVNRIIDDDSAYDDFRVYVVYLHLEVNSTRACLDTVNIARHMHSALQG